MVSRVVHHIQLGKWPYWKTLELQKYLIGKYKAKNLEGDKVVSICLLYHVVSTCTIGSTVKWPVVHKYGGKIVVWLYLYTKYHNVVSSCHIHQC